MYALTLLVLSGLALGQEAEEPVEIDRARYAQQLALGFIPESVQDQTLIWGSEETDDLGRPFVGVEVSASQADLVLHVEAKSKVAKVTPILIAVTPGDDSTAIGDLSPNAGEADGWLRLHTPGAWQVFLLSDTPGIKGKVELSISLYDTSGVGAPATLGTMLQAVGQAPAAAESSAGGPNASIIDSELDPSDPAMDDGANYEVFGFEVEAGTRVRLAALSDLYDLYLVLLPPGGAPIKAESHAVSGSTAIIDHAATVTGEYQLSVFGKQSSAQGAY